MKRVTGSSAPGGAGSSDLGPLAPGGAGSGGRPRAGEGPYYAALDLGTNNCRLLIARPSPDGFRVSEAYSNIVRLGEGLSQTVQWYRDNRAWWEPLKARAALS